MFIMDMSLSAYVSDCAHIYYITALQAYGSEAVDQRNDGDRGFKLEERETT